MLDTSVVVDLADPAVLAALPEATAIAGRQPRRRQFDLLIAAVARSNRLPLATRNPADLAGLAGLVEVHTV
ncbi:hypothetical protein E4P41_17160 [Geodermatophilus sp. DF01-2]|nr:hypothetical protein E4P41_17160 [Geodermatophilus sp. DF01_2]